MSNEKNGAAETNREMRKTQDRAQPQHRTRNQAKSTDVAVYPLTFPPRASPCPARTGGPGPSCSSNSSSAMGGAITAGPCGVQSGIRPAAGLPGWNRSVMPVVAWHSPSCLERTWRRRASLGVVGGFDAGLRKRLNRTLLPGSRQFTMGRAVIHRLSQGLDPGAGCRQSARRHSRICPQTRPPDHA